MLIHHNPFKSIINKRCVFIILIMIGWLFIAWSPTKTSAATFISGDIYNGAHWNIADSPYVINGRVVIRSGEVIIEPGVVVKFMSNSYIIGGGLTAKGTLTNPITFTSIKDDTIGGDTNGDGNNSFPAPGDWGNLTLSGANLENLIIRYGGGRTPDYQGVIAVFNGSVSLINSNIYSNYLGIIQYGGVLEMDNNKIDTNNHGFILRGGTTNINNTEISRNSIGISVTNFFYYPYATLNLNNSKISDNWLGLSVSGGTAKIQNSIFKNNNIGINIVGRTSSLFNPIDLSIIYSEIIENQFGVHIIYDYDIGNINIHHNSIYNNFNYGVYQATLQTKDADFTLNWWGDKSGPFHPIKNPNGKGNQVSDHVLFIPWIGLKDFWSQVQNFSIGWFNLRKTPGTQNKPADDIIKTLPNGWAVKVTSTTDDNDVDINLDGYRWYQVEDKTDGVTGWMAAKNLTDGTVYLDYNPNNQTELQGKAETQLDTADKRKPIILDAVNNYHTKNNSESSLYGGGGGLDGKNNFQKFIQSSSFPKELTLSIAAQESGPSFNNEICSSVKDGGIGIMQITSLIFKGLGSGLDNLLHKNDCDVKTGWIGDLSKYYSNALQGIYANIKDGFRVFQGKYRQKCPKESIFIDGYEFTCQDIEKILIVWGYNGFAKDKDTGLYTGNYLKYISDKLKNLGIYFAGVIYNNVDYLIEKLQIANNNKQVIRLYSPGELQVIDSENRITGLVNGVVKEDIPNSLYEKDIKGVVVFFPYNVNRYRIIGVDTGFYSLSIDYTKAGVLKTFRADNIPITINEIHEYFIDWDALFKNEIGVTIKIDKNGDEIVDEVFISGDTFNQTDIFLQNNTIIDFEPNTLNLGSNGIATVYIELPTGYNVNDISASSIRLNKVVHTLSKPIEISDYDKDGIPDLMVKFEREKIKPILIVGEKIPITIIGKVFYNGNYYYFKGQDIIKVTNNKAGDTLNSAVSRLAWVQKLFNDLGEKVIAAFYKHFVK